MLLWGLLITKQLKSLLWLLTLRLKFIMVSTNLFCQLSSGTFFFLNPPQWNQTALEYLRHWNHSTQTIVIKTWTLIYASFVYSQFAKHSCQWWNWFSLQNPKLRENHIYAYVNLVRYWSCPNIFSKSASCYIYTLYIFRQPFFLVMLSMHY